MKALRNTLILATVAALAFWLYSAPPESTVPPPPAPVAAEAPRPDAKDEVVAQSAAATRVKVAPKPITDSPARPDGNTVEFEVIDGLAIAYGDMILGRVSTGSPAKRGRYEAPTPQLWDRPEIPYVLAPDLPNPNRVLKAFEYFKKHTPVRFVPYSGTGDGIAFESGSDHCLSSLGRTGGLQIIKLDVKCGTGEIIHEIMHALGFIHEQSRPDRDKFVDIFWQNIEDGKAPQFQIVPESFLFTSRGFDFDYQSAMLYRPDSFAKGPGLQTMISKTQEIIVPATHGLSRGDIQRLNWLYFREAAD